MQGDEWLAEFISRYIARQLGRLIVAAVLVALGYWVGRA